MLETPCSGSQWLLMIEEIKRCLHTQPSPARRAQLRQQLVRNIKNAAYLRAKQPFMRGAGQVVDIQRLHVDINRPQRLHRIDATQHAPFVAMTSNSCDIITKAARKLHEAQRDRKSVV